MVLPPDKYIKRDILVGSLQKLADYIEPNPVTYCNLSLVSRSYYAAFTSDYVWRYLDPYEWRKGIHKRFITECAAEHSLMRKYWSNKRTTGNLQLKQHMEKEGVPYDQTYLELGFLIYTILGPNVEGEFQHNYIVNSRQVLWCAIHISPYAFELAGNNLNNDRQIVEYVVQETADVFWNISPELQNDPEIVMKASQHPAVVRFPGQWESVDPALSIAPERFCRDRNIVLEAVSYNREALQYASLELRADKDVVMTAIRTSRAKWTEIEDDVFAWRICAKDPLILQWVSPGLRDDDDVVYAALQSNNRELIYASSRLQSSLRL